MSRFNTPSNGTSKTINLAGAPAYSENAKLELVSLLLTSFTNDQFYRSGADGLKQLAALAGKIPDKEFMAKAAVYARTKFGMRSISHALAAELAPMAVGAKWATPFFETVINRPDDVLEILSYYKGKNNKRMTHAMRKGLGRALARFDDYSLAKYRAEGKDLSLVDALNFVHPKPGERSANAFALLVKGGLKSTDTWEAMLTKAGQSGDSDEEKSGLKAEAWRDLIVNRKIKYFGLLRNLRNIAQSAPDVIVEACAMLTEPELIKKSLVLPFRYLTAIEEIAKLSGPDVRKVLVALNRAIDIACSNVPKWEGETLIALDVSGSMNGRPAQIGALFASVLAKGANADVLTFDTDAKYININPLDSTLTIAGSIPFRGGGTDFDTIFNTANRKYDRIVILSDMQAWVGGHVPQAAFTKYKQRTGANPKIFSFDLQGYGTLQFPESRSEEPHV